jgi:hypothetical protein
MSLKRSHTLYLSSKYRDSGTPYQYTISLPEVIENDPMMEKFKVTLQSFTTYNSWFIVKEGSNTIYVNNLKYTIPSGNYTYQKLAKTIQSIVPSCQVSWNMETNSMTFSYTHYSVTRFDDMGMTLGFLPNTEYVGTQVYSQTPMLPYPDPFLMIHLQNISPMEQNLVMSNHTGEVRIASILAKVLINASPFQLITHQQVLDGEGIYTAENSVGNLEILITDSEGNPFVDMPDHSFTLTIQSIDVEDYDTKDLLAEVKDIKKWMRDLVSLKVYKQPKIYPTNI